MRRTVSDPVNDSNLNAILRLPHLVRCAGKELIGKVVEFKGTDVPIVLEFPVQSHTCLICKRETVNVLRRKTAKRGNLVEVISLPEEEFPPRCDLMVMKGKELRADQRLRRDRASNKGPVAILP